MKLEQEIRRLDERNDEFTNNVGQNVIILGIGPACWRYILWRTIFRHHVE